MADEVEEQGVKTLSKRALKRQAREERSRELRKVKRMAKKEEKKQQQQMAAGTEQVQGPRWEPLPHEPRNPARVEKRKNLNESFNRSLSSVTVAIDCAFESYMTEQEKKSMVQQIAYAYASNRDAPSPFNLEICGTEKVLSERLEKMGATTTWKSWGVNVNPRPIEEAYDKDRMVYLSADSDVVLDKLDPNKVYVIGGIVDRNRHKGLCANKAATLGIPTAKFPLDAYFTKAGFSRVLTTNHCVDVLLEFACSNDWMQACKRGVPIRKLKTRQRGSDDKSEDEKEGSEEEIACIEPPSDIHDKPDPDNTVPSLNKHALIIGSSSDLTATLASQLFSVGWSILFVDADPIVSPTHIESIRQKYIESTGEMAWAKLDCSLDGDVSRLKDIVFKRFERKLDAVIFNDVRTGKTEVDGCQVETTLLTRAIPVRELFRTWFGENRVTPKFVFVNPEEPSESIREWSDEFKKRFAGKDCIMEVPVGSAAESDAATIIEWFEKLDS